MTKIMTTDERKSLDASLARVTTDTLLVLSGSENTSAQAIHDLADSRIKELWRKTFWIANLAVLKTEELEGEDAKLFARGGRYAVIGRCKNSDGKLERAIVQRGYHADLLDSGGAPDLNKIKAAFRAGDKTRSC